jgi:hypothetical protein
VAVLDSRVAPLLAHYPELTEQLIGRVTEQARTLAANRAIIHQARIEVRVHLLLWMLARTVGSRRARRCHSVSVSAALAVLRRRGLVEAVPHGFKLYRSAPEETQDRLLGSR